MYCLNFYSPRPFPFIFPLVVHWKLIKHVSSLFYHILVLNSGQYSSRTLHMNRKIVSVDLNDVFSITFVENITFIWHIYS